MSVKTIVLIRGLGRHGGHWGDFPELLKLALPGWQVELWDLPGFGSRNLEESPQSIEKIAADLVDKYATQDREYLVVGYSLGGMVALEIAQKKSLSIKGLALINSSTGRSKIFERIRPAALLTLVRSTMSRGANKAEAAILSVVSNSPVKQKKVIEDWTGLRVRYPFKLRALYCQLRAASSYQFNEALTKTKTLVIASAKDRLVNVVCSRSLSIALGAAIIEHPSAGHDLVVDDSDWLVEAVRKFAKSL